MEREVEEKIDKILRHTLIKMGIRCDLLGFDYLCCAVKLVIEKPELIHNLCNGLYVMVGKKCDIAKNGCVERSIRHLIENTYISHGFTSLNKMFNSNIYTVHDKPTAGELINLLAEYYNLGLYETSGF